MKKMLCLFLVVLTCLVFSSCDTKEVYHPPQESTKTEEELRKELEKDIKYQFGTQSGHKYTINPSAFIEPVELLSLDNVLFITLDYKHLGLAYPTYFKHIIKACHVVLAKEEYTSLNIKDVVITIEDMGKDIVYGIRGIDISDTSLGFFIDATDKEFEDTVFLHSLEDFSDPEKFPALKIVGSWQEIGGKTDEVITIDEWFSFSSTGDSKWESISYQKNSKADGHSFINKNTGDKMGLYYSEIDDTFSISSRSNFDLPSKEFRRVS